MNPKKLLSLALSSLMAFSGAFCCKAGDPELPLHMTIHGGFQVVYDNIRDLVSNMESLKKVIRSLHDQLQLFSTDTDLKDAYLCRVFVYNVLGYRLYLSQKNMFDTQNCASEGVKNMISSMFPSLDNLRPLKDYMLCSTENDVKRAQSFEGDPMDMLKAYPIPEQYL